MKPVFVALACYSGKPDIMTVHALLDSQTDLASKGYEMFLRSYVDDGILPRVRNATVSEFLASSADDLVMIDDDVAWEAGAIARLLSYPVDVVAGIYPGRTDPETYVVRWDHSHEFLVADPATGLLEMEAVPTGFLRLTRSCLERMVEAYAHLEYADEVMGGKKSFCLFDFELLNGRYWGEDFTFCRRWRDIGGKVWADPEIKFAHVGRRAYHGHLGNWLRGRDDFAEAKQAYDPNALFVFKDTAA